MSFEWVSYFECATCGELARADAVEYDPLGYSVCPLCGERSGPLASVESDPRAAEAAE
ncbi:hypothetical protein [Halopelagius longus]|uniref:Small CPxCG-related zinc finger protein n=1 Tax=Halopelagius longus TaxID=1236180 RepID=A0A1H1BPY8_9EURY|nr:hypothetical protein [Halopelagius longus]SDQ54022.1 hypothetical protein SAMN05216278_1896 [Halopelagius longus]